jgi:hypothetical protein
MLAVYLNKVVFKRKTLLGCLFLLLCSALPAQETKVYFGIGGIYNAFQDTRFSDVQFSKSTVLPELGFSRVSDKNLWHANASFFFLDYAFPNYDTITYTKLAYNVRFGYLRGLKPSFYLGFNWDVLDYYKRQTEFLDNSSDAYKLSSDFYLSGKYLWPVADDWHFQFGLDLGLFSFINTEPSFTANLQQNIVDIGEVTFIDADTKRPYKFKNMEWKPIGEQFSIRTLIELNYRRKLGLFYSWDLRTYSDNKGYPVTDARHTLTLRFNFINLPKQ